MRNGGTLDRRAVAAALLRDPGDLLVVTGLGAPSYDAAAAGERPLNLWGAMGGAAMVGLGIALAQPTRRVLVLTGDGEMRTTANRHSWRSRGRSASTSCMSRAVAVAGQPQAAATAARSVVRPVWLGWEPVSP